MSSRAYMRAARYTPQPVYTRTSSAPNDTEDYRRGYDAGRAAALLEFRSESADANLAGRAAVAPRAAQVSPAAPLGARAEAESDETPENDAAIGRTNPARALNDSDEAAPAEVASLHLPLAGGPISLRGSLASLERQNTTLESEGLERILDESDLASRIAHGLLVPLPVSADLTVNSNLIENHRYCRPWTARFVADLAHAHAAAFHRPVEVSSAVRTVEYQKRLMRSNGNAAAAEGDIVSPHLTGATIDIAKQGMSHEELMWMRRRLLALEDAGKIDVEEEFEQACFHITVYKTYSPASGAHKAAPAARDAANRHKAAPPAAAQPNTQPNTQPDTQPNSSLPSSIAAGMLAPQGR